MNQETLSRLSHTAAQIRLGILESTHAAKSGHPGGSLSIAELLSFLYFEEMRVDPKKPQDPDRDRLVLSKGHAAPGLYAALALRGYFPVEMLKTLRQADSILQGHPDMKHIPGVDMSTGSLGQGISAACGMAIAAKMAGKDYRTYTIVGSSTSSFGKACMEMSEALAPFCRLPLSIIIQASATGCVISSRYSGVIRFSLSK